ncbi:protein of unknown function [Serratia sp. Tan611]|nr:protein of unknown function [Serratia sp. Tan611]
MLVNGNTATDNTFRGLFNVLIEKSHVRETLVKDRTFTPDGDQPEYYRQRQPQLLQRLLGQRL